MKLLVIERVRIACNRDIFARLFVCGIRCGIRGIFRFVAVYGSGELIRRSNSTPLVPSTILQELFQFKPAVEVLIKSVNYSTFATGIAWLISNSIFAS
jgi:hypothetical protein